MKSDKLRSSLLPVTLCTLIAILLVKLALIVGGSFFQQPVTSCQVEAPLSQCQPAVTPEPEVQSSIPSIVSESFAATTPAEKQQKTAKLAPAQAHAQTQTPVVDSLNFMQQKESELRKREEQLKEKEESLARIEKEVEQKTKQLLAIQKEIQSFKTEKQEGQNNKVRSLSKIYGTMKPKEAAKLLENLDDKIVMGIISTMTPDEAAAILSIMEVKKAAKISEALIER